MRSAVHANRKYRLWHYYGTNLFSQISFPIILSQVVGSDSQCLSPTRPSSQNLSVWYEIVPLKVKCKGFSRYL